MQASPKGRVILFTGPTGAGKSTVAEAWAASRDVPTGWFDHDDARYILRSGHVARSAVRRDESLREEADRQWLLAAAVCESMARAYTSRGLDFALSAFRPPGEWKGCWSDLDAMDPAIVVLLPNTDTLLARDRGRTGRAHTGEETVQRALVYDWNLWRNHPRVIMVDNSEQTVEATVESVDAQIRRLIRRG